MSVLDDVKRAALAALGYLGNIQDMEYQFWLNSPYTQSSNPTFLGGPSFQSQIYTAASNQLTSSSPYRSIANSASAVGITVATTPKADETRVFTNVGVGTLTVNYNGRTGATAKAVAQDNAITLAFNSTLNYWTME